MIFLILIPILLFNILLALGIFILLGMLENHHPITLKRKAFVLALTILFGFLIVFIFPKERGYRE